MAQATRTLNPLHFEDLDPHRFEDLIRQLAYDFRAWRSLEALGRSGSEEGMDIRGQETIEGTVPRDEEEDVSEPGGGSEPSVDRLWVIQCKREKNLGPAKVRSILEDFFKGEVRPYGYILAAACNFSKAAREAAAEVLRQNDVDEFYLWGKGEVEDLLVQPKNDHLLFAYFGISLQIRRRSMRTDIRSRLTLKRKLVKELGELRVPPHFKAVLVRDPADVRYPFVGSEAEFVRNPAWRYWYFHAHEPPDHVAMITRKYFAYVNWDTGEWDFTNESNEALVHQPELSGIERRWWDPDEKSQQCRAYWELHVPEPQRAWAIEVGIIEYERILACDELGDIYNEGPHLLVEYVDAQPFKGFRQFIESAVPSSNQCLGKLDESKHVQLFPKSIPDEREQWYTELERRINEGPKGQS